MCFSLWKNSDKKKYVVKDTKFQKISFILRTFSFSSSDTSWILILLFSGSSRFWDSDVVSATDGNKTELYLYFNIQKGSSSVLSSTWCLLALFHHNDLHFTEPLFSAIFLAIKLLFSPMISKVSCWSCWDS